MSSQESCQVSIVITTRNRGRDAVAAARSALSQSLEDIEVLIYDDASTDNSAVLIQEELQDPRVRVWTSRVHRGYIHWRNQGFHEANGSYVFSIDDDAVFTNPHTIADNVRLLTDHPLAFAVAVPFIEPKSGAKGRDPNSLKPGQQIRSYIGCSHLVRRKDVVEAQGYRELLVHQTEERDLCLRMLQQGRTVIYGTSGPVVHFVSPRRDQGRLSYYGYRNTLLVTGLNAPFAVVIPKMFIDSLRLLRHRFQLKRLPQAVMGIAAGWCATARYWLGRTPVSWRTYRSFCRLPQAGPMSCSADLVSTLHDSSFSPQLNLSDFPDWIAPL